VNNKGITGKDNLIITRNPPTNFSVYETYGMEWPETTAAIPIEGQNIRASLQFQLS
jgi:hypothetical protein